MINLLTANSYYSSELRTCDQFKHKECSISKTKIKTINKLL